MDALLQNIQENAVAYGVTAAVLVPLIYAFRQHTFPIIFHTLEAAFYMCSFHLVLGGMVRFFQYFKSASHMENALGEAAATPVMTTPINLNFWQRELYEPEWLFYFEVAAALALLFLVIKIRPVRYKGKNRYKGKDGGRGSRRVKKSAHTYSSDFGRH
ncbi:MAG: hypothetical protein IID08_05435 [Candidatus Hydrogenedentes bacterium]|nr:hypothetical protein [Candidatus Hydrogenedentota bacterium]